MSSEQAGASPRRYRLAAIKAAPGAVLSLLGAPVGGLLTDGRSRVSITQASSAVDISRWQMENIELHLCDPDAAPPALKVLALLPLGGAVQRRVSPLAVELIQEVNKAVLLMGLPAGSILTDGVHQLVSASEQQVQSILEWDLESVSLIPPKGWHDPIDVRVQTQGLDQEDRAQVGRLRIRVVSSNAYFEPRVHTLVRPSRAEFALEITHQHPEPDGRQLSIHAKQSQPSLVRDVLADTQLDDDGLQLLEAKFRLH